VLGKTAANNNNAASRVKSKRFAIMVEMCLPQAALSESKQKIRSTG